MLNFVLKCVTVTFNYFSYVQNDEGQNGKRDKNILLLFWWFFFFTSLKEF